MAYSVSFGSGNTSTSSLSRHTLQARGSLSPCSTCRSNRSLLLIKNIMRRQVWVQRQETFQLFTFSKHLLHMHKDVLYLLIQSRSLKKTCKKACDDVLSHFRQILLGLCLITHNMSQKHKHGAVSEWENICSFNKRGRCSSLSLPVVFKVNRWLRE